MQSPAKSTGLKSWVPPEPKVGEMTWPEYQARCDWLAKRFRAYARRAKRDPNKALEIFDEPLYRADQFEMIALQLEALLWNDMIKKGIIEINPYRYRRDAPNS